MSGLGIRRIHKSTNVRSITGIVHRTGTILVTGLMCGQLTIAQSAPPEGQPGHVTIGDADASLRAGAIFAAQGHWENARQAFADAAMVRPRLVLAHYNLGVALVALGRISEGLRAYDAALRLDPNLPEALVNVGYELAKLGRRDEAISYLERAVRAAPSLAIAQHDLGVVLADLGRLDEAVVALEGAARLRPDDPAIRRALADTHYNMGVALSRQRRWTDAITKYRAALGFSPEFPEAFNGLGVALARLKRHDASLPMYTEALRQRPTFAEARHNLAISLATLGHYAAAIEACQVSLRTRPDFLQTRTLLDELQRALAPSARTVLAAAVGPPGFASR